MKSFRYILFVSIFIFCQIANAQVGKARKDFSVGFSGGYTMNQVSFNPTIKQFMKGGTQFGFTSRYICEKYYNSICGIQIEVNYQDLGWKEEIEDVPYYNIDGKEGSVINNQYTRNLRCIEIPFLMQMGWGKERKGFKFLFDAGPYIQYFLSSSEHFSGEPWNPEYRPNFVNYQYGKKIDNRITYGIQAGLGVELSTGIGHFIIDGRYAYGLGDIFDNSKKGDFSRSANGTIGIKLTYLFDIVRTNL